MAQQTPAWVLDAIIHEANRHDGMRVTAARAAQIVSAAQEIEAVIPRP